MTLEAIRPHRPVEIVPAGRATKLGRAAGFDYVTINGNEHLLEQAALLEPGDVASQSGQLFVSIPTMITDDDGRSMQVGAKYRRALPVPEGTYQRTAEREAERKAPAAHRPVDALSFPILAARSPRVVGAPSHAASLYIGLDAAVQNGDPTAGIAPGRGPIRGRDLMPFLESKGIQLELHAGRLLVTAPKGRMTGDLRAVVDRATPLLVGYLTDAPLRCDLPHPSDGDTPEAWTLLVGGLAACEGHASGELDV
jgi:hypothetical protein